MDRSYSPYHLVEYYRYLRFFPDGTVTTCTSADDPQTVRHGQYANKRLALNY